MRRWFSAWAPVVLWCALIFVISSIPKLTFFDETWLDLAVRKTGHMAVFGILARLTARALDETAVWPRRRIRWVSAVFVFLYAISDEYHQSFVVGRGASALDVAIDTLGALIALSLKR